MGPGDSKLLCGPTTIQTNKEGVAKDKNLEMRWCGIRPRLVCNITSSARADLILKSGLDPLKHWVVFSEASDMDLAEEGSTAASTI